VFITAARYVGAAVIGMLGSQERSKAFNRHRTWSRILTLFMFMVGLAFLIIGKADPIAYLSFVAGGVLYFLEYFQSRNREPQTASK
jgi:hypothetical protein